MNRASVSYIAEMNYLRTAVDKSKESNPSSKDPNEYRVYHNAQYYICRHQSDTADLKRTRKFNGSEQGSGFGPKQLPSLNSDVSEF
jgi:hypothetical protein